MAILKISRGDRVIEMNLPIYAGDNAPKSDPDRKTTSSTNNGLITHHMSIPVIVGKQIIYYPYEYKQSVHGVFITEAPEELKPYVMIYDINTNNFTLEIRPNPFNYKSIKLASTGY